MEASSLTPNEWLAAIQRAIDNEEQTVEPGFFTRAQIMENIGLGKVQTVLILQKLVKKGIVEKKSFKIRAWGNVVRPVPHYRLKAWKKILSRPSVNPRSSSRTRSRSG